MSSKMKQFTQDDFELVATALTVGKLATREAAFTVLQKINFDGR